MKTKLFFRLNRAITCVNAHDSDETFNRKLMEVRRYARFINENDDSNLKEIIKITNDTLSKSRHSQREKGQISDKLHSIQQNIANELYDCLSLGLKKAQWYFLLLCFFY